MEIVHMILRKLVYNWYLQRSQSDAFVDKVEIMLQIVGKI